MQITETAVALAPSPADEEVGTLGQLAEAITCGHGGVAVGGEIAAIARSLTNDELSERIGRSGLEFRAYLQEAMRRRWTQKRIGEALGVSQQAVSKRMKALEVAPLQPNASHKSTTKVVLPAGSEVVDADVVDEDTLTAEDLAGLVKQGGTITTKPPKGRCRAHKLIADAGLTEEDPAAWQLLIDAGYTFSATLPPAFTFTPADKVVEPSKPHPGRYAPDSSVWESLGALSGAAKTLESLAINLNSEEVKAWEQSLRQTMSILRDVKSTLGNPDSTRPGAV